MVRMIKDKAEIVVNDDAVEFYKSVGFEEFFPEEPPKARPVPIKRELESEPAPKPNKPRASKA